MLENIRRHAACFINGNYRDCTPGCVTTMLRRLGLQSLHQPQVQRPHCWIIVDVSPTCWETLYCSRFRIEENSNDRPSSSRQSQRLTLLLKTVRRLTPNCPSKWDFDRSINSKRLVKPRNPTCFNFKTTNTVINHARNNSQSYRVHPTKTAV